MNKKFLSAILFGALMVTSTGTFVSCKDYDDEIDEINAELVDIKSQISALQNKIDAGKYVTNVTKNGEGIVVTWNDGTSSTIETIKGDKGEKGDATQVTIDPVTKNWLVDGVDTGVCAEGKAGEAGEAAATPIFTIGEDGHLYVQYGEDGEKEDLGVSTGGIYYVEDGPAIKLHICDEEGNWKDIVLPQTAAISSIDAVTITNNKLTNGSTIVLYYGTAADDGKYFDGTTFKKGDVLTSQESVSKVTAQINPTIADATKYNFYLTDSKGASIFTLGTAKANMTDGALTRAASANKGIYDMSVGFIAGVTAKQIATVVAAPDAAYAIATKDAYDNEILSNYDVKVAPQTGNATLTTEALEIEVGKTLDLSTGVTAKYVVDINYSIAENLTAKKEELGVTLNGSSFSATKTGTIDVTVNWLKQDGSKGTAQTITVTVIPVKNAGTLAAEWTITNAANKNVVKVEYTTYGTIANLTAPLYTSGDNKGNAAPGITYATVTETDKYGYVHNYIVYTFDAATVIPGTYAATATYGYNNNDKLTINVTIKEPTAAFDFKPLAAYFSGDNATAYGIPNASGTIDYELKKLFGLTDWTHITFSETVPASYKNAKDQEVVAHAWLNTASVLADANKVKWTADDKISVDQADLEANLIYGGAYSARAITVKYQPFGNVNLKPVTYTFNLTIKSEIFEGTLEYVKPVMSADGKTQTGWAAGDVKEVDGGKNATLKLTELLGKDVYGKAYDLVSDSRVTSVEVVLADDNAKEYLAVDKTVFDNTNNVITISKKSANTAIVTPPTCTVQVKVTDKWNKVKTVNVTVKVTK